MTSVSGTILFAGGGTGGHIFPNLAVLERLHERPVGVSVRFLVSARPLDAHILEQHKVPFAALPVKPLTWRPWRWPMWISAWRASTGQLCQLMNQEHVVAVVSTGGFVSGPVVLAAQRVGVPVALVNLDAVLGIANRKFVRRASIIFSAYDVAISPAYRRIGMPLRRAAIGLACPQDARKSLGLDPSRQTLLIVGGSQGAASLNAMMPSLLHDFPEVRAQLAHWQLLHLAGSDYPMASLSVAYEQAGVPAVVQPFCNSMGLAWAAASLAVSRAGAGSVAEAWANAVPTIFLPYPHHRDQHQKHNALPLVKIGGGLIFEDRVNPGQNAAALASSLVTLMADFADRQAMHEALRQTWPGDGAAVIADWLETVIRK